MQTLPRAVDSIFLAQGAKTKSCKQKAAVSSLLFKVGVDRGVHQHLLWEATRGFGLPLCSLPKGHPLSHGGVTAGGARRVQGDHRLSASLLEGIPSPFRILSPRELGLG